jgi:hypothetical protein
MPDPTDDQKAPEFDITQASETLAENRLDQAADEAAEKAQRTEQRYDRDHSIFTK